jgi:pyrimidine-nucleoside phosphorylase
MNRPIEDLLGSMRAFEVQDEAAIAAFVAGVVSGEVSRPQAAAWLAWAFARGLSDAETVALTRAMTDSGDRFRWGPGAEVIDKHSTGGVGDKVSLVLAPLWAELGRRVPMISGRGLGHTGGTLDKLEAIPGFRTDLDEGSLRRQLDEIGCFVNGQTHELAPADRILYALRNETCTVPSIPLIVGSILSKKLAEGLDRLVLDVKCGSGAFMTTVEDARALAEALVRVAGGAGLPASARVTAMDRPLGVAVGNANEVLESVACLQGGGPPDLRALTLALAEDEQAAAALDSGRAYERFLRMVEAQGGDARAVDRGALRGAGTKVDVLVAERDGVVARVDALACGRAAFVLGAGRRRAEDPVDFGVGLDVHVAPGDAVERGQPLVSVRHRDGHALAPALAMLGAGVVVDDEAPPALPLVIATIGV